MKTKAENKTPQKDPVVDTVLQGFSSLIAGILTVTITEEFTDFDSRLNIAIGLIFAAITYLGAMRLSRFTITAWLKRFALTLFISLSSLVIWSVGRNRDSNRDHDCNDVRVPDIINKLAQIEETSLFIKETLNRHEADQLAAEFVPSIPQNRIGYLIILDVSRVCMVCKLLDPFFASPWRRNRADFGPRGAARSRQGAPAVVFASHLEFVC